MILKFVLKVILYTFIPAIMAYLGQEKSILDVLVQKNFLGDSFPLDTVKQFSIIASIAIVGLVLSSKNEINSHKKIKVERQRTALIVMVKQSVLSALSSIIEDSTIKDSVSIRIWIEKKDFITHIRNWCINLKGELPEKYFIIKHIEGLSNFSDNTKDLKFQVEPKVQGLVGRCYNSKQVLYEEDAKYSTEDYNLTSFQKNKTGDSRFILCCPVFNDKNEVISIISFDSTHKISIPQEKEEATSDIIVGFCQSIYENAPDLFK